MLYNIFLFILHFPSIFNRFNSNRATFASFYKISFTISNKSSYLTKIINIISIS